MPNLVGIFVSSTYFAITLEVYISVGFILAHMCKNVEPIWPFSMLVVTYICNVAVIYVW